MSGFGDMFVVLCISTKNRHDKSWQKVTTTTKFSIPIVCNTYEEAKAWVDEVQPSTKFAYEIHRVWNPRTAAGHADG